MPCDTGDHSKDDDMTPDQRDEYQRLLASPTSTARELVRLRDALRAQCREWEHGSVDGTDRVLFVGDVGSTIRDIIYGMTPTFGDASEHCPECEQPIREDIALAAAESQIAALKVDLAAMMRERDGLRALNLDNASVHAQCEEHERTLRFEAEDARDAALADASQARAERDMALEQRDVAIKHAQRLGEENARLTAAVDAYRAQQEVIEAAKGFKHSGVPHERWVRLWNALDELEKVDARRGQGGR